MSKLRELIAIEIAERDNTENMLPALKFVVYDKHPKAMSDTKAAVATIVERANDNSGALTYVTRSIQDDVVKALEAAHPKRAIMCCPIVSPGMSVRELAQSDSEMVPAPSRNADAVARAAERLAMMRGSD